MAFKGISPHVLAVYQQAIVTDPPPGETPTFQNPHRALAGWTSLAVVCLILTTLFVAMRMYTRFAVIKHLWWDDCMYIHRLAVGVISFC